MAYARLPLESEVSLRRDSPFSYDCAGCGRCCHDKGIRIGPYEALRLARARGLSTTAFLAQFTEAGGTVLRNRADGTCPFLAGHACEVHADRPLVCRLYPLGRQVDPDGAETFGLLAPQNGSEGRRGEAGTVAEFLRRQGVEPFLAVAARYAALYDRMLDVLSRLEPATPQRLANDRSALDTGELASAWLDIDATVPTDTPQDPPTLVDLHVAALTRWLDDIEAHTT